MPAEFNKKSLNNYFQEKISISGLSIYKTKRLKTKFTELFLKLNKISTSNNNNHKKEELNLLELYKFFTTNRGYPKINIKIDTKQNALLSSKYSFYEHILTISLSDAKTINKLSLEFLVKLMNWCFTYVDMSLSWDAINKEDRLAITKNQKNVETLKNNITKLQNISDSYKTVYAILKVFRSNKWITKHKIDTPVAIDKQITTALKTINELTEGKNNKLLPKKIANIKTQLENINVNISLNKQTIKTVLSVVKKDYYGMLGVHPKAKQADIRKAYRKKAKTYHPDVHSSNSHMNKAFKLINKAHKVLISNDNRLIYDRYFMDFFFIKNKKYKKYLINI
jgi:hypothetical protein